MLGDSIRKETILLVEDDEATAFLERKHLVHAGYHVLAASSAKESLHLLEGKKVDLAILDYQLPDSTGIDLAGRIRQQQKDLPVILATGNYDPTLILRAMRMGVSDFIYKTPDFLDEIPAAVLRVLNHLRMQRALASSEARLAAILHSAIDPILTIDAQMRIILANPAAQAALGCSIGALRGQQVRRFISNDLPPARPLHLSTMAERTEVECLRADGRSFPADAAISETRTDEETFYTLILRDLSAQKTAETRLRDLAHFDPLTHLANRTLFFDRFGQALAASKRSKRGGAVLFLDLDHFKGVNDAHGHAMGDALLVGVAERLGREVRPTDTLCRLGGDEFAILLPDGVDAQGAATVSQKILNALSPPFLIDGLLLHTSASIGIALYPSDETDADALLRYADAGMYAAKQRGRGRYAFYHDETDASVFAQQQMEQTLKSAIKRGGFHLDYQPRVCLRTGSVIGMEALLRLQHPTHGLLLPSAFLQVAEESGLISPIGEWVVETAIAQTLFFRKEGFPSVPVSINLSIRQLSTSGIVDHVSSVLNATGFPPSDLEFEIPEGVFSGRSGTATSTLTALHRMGIRIVLDQFGVGPCSLALLRELPISAFKIDQSTVREMTSNPSTAQWVSGVVGMAHGLNAASIAQGVETAEEYSMLGAIGCDAAQGYWISAPHCATDPHALFHPHFETHAALHA